MQMTNYPKTTTVLWTQKVWMKMSTTLWILIKIMSEIMRMAHISLKYIIGLLIMTRAFHKYFLQGWADFIALYFVHTHTPNLFKKRNFAKLRKCKKKKLRAFLKINKDFSVNSKVHFLNKFEWWRKYDHLSFSAYIYRHILYAWVFIFVDVCEHDALI